MGSLYPYPLIYWAVMGLNLLWNKAIYVSTAGSWSCHLCLDLLKEKASIYQNQNAPPSWWPPLATPTQGFWFLLASIDKVLLGLIRRESWLGAAQMRGGLRKREVYFTHPTPQTGRQAAWQRGRESEGGSDKWRKRAFPLPSFSHFLHRQVWSHYDCYTVPSSNYPALFVFNY